MLIHKPTQKVVLKVRDLDRVTTVIPTAKRFPFKGVELLAVPHRDDETRVLRNLGFNVPAPVEHYYKWPGQYKPFKAQLATTSFLTTNPKAFVLNDMGTGKTLSVLWAWDYLRTVGLARKMLVISPLSTLERAWADEIFRHFPGLSVGVLHGTRDRRLKLLAENFDIYLINHDGIKTIEQELIDKVEIDTVVVDEIASFRNSSTARWKSLRKIVAGRERIWGLTGTPTPNLPTDAWAQTKLISPDRVPKFFGAFKDATMKQLGPFKWVPRDGATQLVAEAMQPSIRFSREECIDLPPCIYETREVPLTADQRKAYKAMLDKLKFEMGEEQVTAVNEAVKLSKLLQICCGAAYAGDGSVVGVDVATRVKEVKEIIEQAGGKSLVFVPFTAALEQVSAALREHWNIGVVHGGTKKHDRDEIFREFQSGESMQAIVANPGTLSHGLTLTAANTIIWFGPPVSAEQYQQANARVSRPGQKQTQFIVHIESTPVERKIYERLRGKRAMQGLLLEILNGENS